MLSSPPPLHHQQQHQVSPSSIASPSPKAPFPSPSQVLTTSTATTGNSTSTFGMRNSTSSNNNNNQTTNQTATLPPRWSLDDFDFGKQIGEGRFGQVYLAREKSSGYKVAVKAIRKEDVIRLDMKHQLEREVRLQKYASRHPHVLGMFAYFWDAKFVYCVMEYADGGDLSQFTAASASASSHQSSPARTPMTQRNKTSMNDEATVACWMKQLLEAVAFLHSKNIVHRDIKPENIMLKRGRIKLGDFTWCVLLGKEAPFDRRRTICGTLDYLSPELISHMPYDHHLDVWSIGVVAYELLVGKPPFEHPRPVDTCLSIQRGDFTIPHGIMSEQAEDFLRKILIVEPEKRASCKELLEHSWIVSAPPTPMSERRQKYVEFHHEHGKTKGGSKSRSRSSRSKSRSQRRVMMTSSSKIQQQHQHQQSTNQSQNQTINNNTNTTKASSSASTIHFVGDQSSHQNQTHHQQLQQSSIHHPTTNTSASENNISVAALSLNNNSNNNHHPQYPSNLFNTNQQEEQQQQQQMLIPEEEENVSRALELSGIDSVHEGEMIHQYHQLQQQYYVDESSTINNSNNNNNNNNTSAFGEYQLSLGTSSTTNNNNTNVSS